VPNHVSIFRCIGSAGKSDHFRGTHKYFTTNIFFYGEGGLLARRPPPDAKPEGHPLSAVRDCLYNIFAATPISGGRLLYPQHDDTPCRGDTGLSVVIRTTSEIIVLNILPNICIFQLILLDDNGEDLSTSHGCM